MKKNQNLISINLTNLSSVDSDINLFSYSNNQSTQSLYVASVEFTTEQGITGTINGVGFSKFFAGLTVSDFINKANSFYSGDILFNSELNLDYPFYKIFARILNESYILIDIKMDSTDPFILNTVLPDTTVTVNTDSLSYTEVLNELHKQRYILDSVDVYASNSKQVSSRWKKTEKELNGISEINYDTPRVDPMQKQFAIVGIESKFIPSSLNVITYNVQGNQNVRLIFYFRGSPELSEIKKTEQKFISEPIKENKMITVERNINPIFDLLKIKRTEKISLKDNIKETLVIRDVSDEEIYNSFDGENYSEII